MARAFHRAAAVLLALAAVGTTAQEDASVLRRLVTLSRHGSRAPNDVVQAICPRNAANLQAYKVPLTQLTEIGMNQLLAVGEEVRNVYMSDDPDDADKAFLSRSLNGVNHSHFETYFRADAATRCSQSATALGYGLYPDGTGPQGFPHQPVPVTMQLVENEHAFAAPKGPCKATMQADCDVYAQTRAPELFEQYKDVLDTVAEVCGVPIADFPSVPGGEDVVLGVKDIADMFVFDRDEGLPLPEGMTPEARDQLQQLAFTNLMERYYTTERELTYWVGGFGDLLLNTLHGGALPTAPSSADYRYFSFHGHRELLHALSLMLGWNFHFEGLPEALNQTALHPGTTMFFELRSRALTAEEAEANPGELEDYFVRTFVWSPFTEREQVTLSKCSQSDCPLAEFSAIITDHIARTGTWETICNYDKPPSEPIDPSQALAQGPAAPQVGTRGFMPWASTNNFVIVLGVAMAVGLAFGVFKLYAAATSTRRGGYTTL